MFDEMDYQFDKDFQILSWKRGKVQEKVEEGSTEFLGKTFETQKGRIATMLFYISKLRTYNNGTCQKLEPKFSVTRHQRFARIRIYIALNSFLQGMDYGQTKVTDFTFYI